MSEFEDRPEGQLQVGEPELAAIRMQGLTVAAGNFRRSDSQVEMSAHAETGHSRLQ